MSVQHPRHAPDLPGEDVWKYLEQALGDSPAPDWSGAIPDSDRPHEAVARRRGRQGRQDCGAQSALGPQYPPPPAPSAAWAGASSPAPPP